MIIRVNIKTGEETIIEPINDKDREGLKQVMKDLYHIHEKKRRAESTTA